MQPVRAGRQVSISAAFLGTLALAAGLGVAVLGFLWLSGEYGRFHDESEAMRRGFLDEQRATVRREVDAVLDYIHYRASRTDDVLRSSLRAHSDAAHAMVTHLLEVERARLPRAELERLVCEAIRPMRFDRGRGHCFIVTMGGVAKLFPNARQIEGRSVLDLEDGKGNLFIRNEIRLLERTPEGFVYEDWPRGGGSREQAVPEMTFVRRIEALDWYLGTSESVADFESNLQDELLDRIAHVRFGAEGYVFVNTFDGDALITDGHRVTTPTNLWQLTDPNGVKVIQEERRAATKPDGGFIYYTWNRLSRAEPAPKVSFVKGYAPWRWMIGAGVYLDDIDAVIAARRAELQRVVRARILGIGGVIVGLGLAVALVAELFGRRIRRNFETFSAFFERAATQSTTIDESQLHFSEFVSLAHSANAMIEARRKAEAEKRDLEEQLHRSRRMESLGLLTGGVAHDLNNILTSLVMYPDLMLIELEPDGPMRRRVVAIKEAGQRAAAVVADLLAASRGGRTSAEVMSLNATVERFLQSPEAQKLAGAHPDVSVRTTLAPDALNVMCSETHITKTLMNLIANAMEAVSGAGEIAISTENRHLEQPLTGYETVPSGEYVVLRVADSGTGIAAGDLARIFEPFFTKKILGRPGTGLGLTVVWHTVKDHDGFINVSSGERGTTFELYFPACRQQLAPTPAPLSVGDLSGNGESILVVDDDPTQREIASELLNRLGYDVTVAASGEEAVSLVTGKKFDLLVLDMVMGTGMSGRETYEAVLRVRPNQEAIIVSGYAETEDIRLTLDLGAGEAVLKPYTIERFGRAVRDQLVRGRGQAGRVPS